MKSPRFRKQSQSGHQTHTVNHDGAITADTLLKYESSVAHDLRGRITSLRATVRLKRLELNNQRVLYIQYRNYVDGQMAEFRREAEAMVESAQSKQVLSEPSALPKIHDSLIDASMAMEHQENLTKELENEVSSLEYWLEHAEGEFYSLPEVAFDSLPLPVYSTNNLNPSKYDSATHNHITDSFSTSSQSRGSGKPIAHHESLHRKSQRVIFLRERLDELDHEHATELELRDCNKDTGDMFEPLLGELIEAYETQKSHLARKLLEAEREEQGLRARIYPLQHWPIIHQNVDGIDQRNKGSEFRDGILRRFPGTYNEGHGFGLRKDRIATGYLPFHTRVERWRKHLLVSLDSELGSSGNSLRIHSNRLTNPADDGNLASSKAPFDASYEWTSASSDSGPEQWRQHSVWQGDKPSMRYSNPELHSVIFDMKAHFDLPQRPVSATL